MCPRENDNDMSKPKWWYQGWADSEIREHASSGGAASAIIRAFIKHGGYVASCLFDSGKFVFEVTNEMAVARKFAGSKYVKSNPEKFTENSITIESKSESSFYWIALSSSSGESIY